MEPDGNSSIEVVCRVHSFRNQLFGLQLGLKDSVHIEGNNEECFDGSSQDKARTWTVVASKDGIGKLQQHWDMVDGIGI